MSAKSSRKADNYRQLLAGCIALLLYLQVGVGDGFSAVLIPQLQSKYSALKITDDESSWIASVFMLSMPIGSLLSGVLMDIYGRKKLFQLSYIPLFLGWAVISQADTAFIICLGRLITGFAIGMEAAVLVYIVEITESPKHRAILLSLMSPVTGFGTIISHLLGHFLFWRNAAIVLSFFSAFCCALIFVIPESPVWLLSRNDIRGAEKSLEWLQTGNQNIKDELKEIQKNKISHPKVAQKETSLLKRIHVTKAWKPFLILTAFFVLQQCAGYTIVLYYAVNFYELFDTPIDGFVSSIVFTSLGFLTSVLLTCIIDKFSRKTITIISAAGVGVTCTIAAIYQYLYANEHDKPVFWLPLFCMWIDVIFCCLGIKTLPWTMIGELFPREVRDFMSGLQLTVAYLILFIAIKLYPLTVSLIKIHGVLTMFSISGFATIIFAIFLLPETRGKTLAEIEEYWVS